MVLPGTDGIHRHAGVGKTTNIVKPQRGRAIADSSRCVGSGSEIRLRIHFLADFQQLSLLIQRM